MESISYVLSIPGCGSNPPPATKTLFWFQWVEPISQTDSTTLNPDSQPIFQKLFTHRFTQLPSWRVAREPSLLMPASSTTPQPSCARSRPAARAPRPCPVVQPHTSRRAARSGNPATTISTCGATPGKPKSFVIFIAIRSGGGWCKARKSGRGAVSGITSQAPRA
jgi:hypothetical protein